MKRTVLALALAGGVLAPSLAAATTWEFDPTHTSITFKVRHLFTKVTGVFHDISGDIEFDPESPESGSVWVTIPVSSIDTNNEKRDGHLKSEDFFWAEKHPNLTFRSTKSLSTENGLTVDGILTMRGVEKPVTLDVEFLGSGPDGFGSQRAGFTVGTTINRQDWGISWNKTLDQGGVMLGDDVEIRIDVEATAKHVEES
jgi:polyisoprenoid-binding protein YceI